MRYVVAIAETGSFTRAAERCHVVQSALSHQVARLERELGARLFDRTSRRVRLTAAGDAFLPAARQALEAAERAATDVASAMGEVRGRLALGAIPTVSAVDLPALLQDFHRDHPQVRIGLRIGDSDELVKQVREGELDVAFLGLPATTNPQGVRTHELAHDRHVAILPPGHPLAGEVRIRLEQVTSEVFVDFPAGTAARAQSDQAFAAAGLAREVAIEVSAADLMARFVQRGLGVALLPAASTPKLDGVVTVPVTDGPARIEHVIWSHFEPRPAATAFLSALDIPAVDLRDRGRQRSSAGWWVHDRGE